MLPFLNEEQFSFLLGQKIRPGQPIDDASILQGRQNLLRDVKRALASPGMHAFIHGERGVGKTSIALTVGKDLLKGDPPLVGCEGCSSIFQLTIDICRVLVGGKLLQKKPLLGGTYSVGYGGAKAEAKFDGMGRFNIPDSLKSINEAVTLIRDSVAASSMSPALVVIDEVDQAQGSDFRSDLANLIKAVHDQRVPIKFIMCGIGKTLDEIIGSHLSAGRPLAPFEVPLISHDARWAIVQNASDHLQFNVPQEFKIRIGQISDGYPYYVHLLSYHLLWSVYEHCNDSAVASTADFHSAVLKSIERAEAPLKLAYNTAIQKTTNSSDYEEVLWAMADKAHFERQIKEIHEKSYQPIMIARRRSDDDGKLVPILDVDRFRQRLYRLCEPTHGSIIERKRNSWYSFRENVLRGYVRLVADRNGVKLGADHF